MDKEKKDKDDFLEKFKKGERDLFPSVERHWPYTLKELGSTSTHINSVKAALRTDEE